MSQYFPFAPNVEVNGQTVLSVVNGVHNIFKPKMVEILKKNNIENPHADGWYKQIDWLNAFKEIAENIGNNTLFAIGKAVPENAIFPPDIDNLEKALNSIDVAYQQNHRGGEIGYYKLVTFDAYRKEAIMECKNPYPCYFDRGIITAVVRKFAPVDTIETFVELVSDKPGRQEGSDSSWYVIRW